MRKVQNILEELKTVRSIASFKTRKKEILITHMRNKSGHIEATRKGIAKVFAKYNKDLYSRKTDERKDETRAENTRDHADDDIEDDEQDRHILEPNRKELMIALNSLKKRKTADSKGIKAADPETITMVHEIFNMIIKRNSMVPNSWKKAMITVIYLQGRKRDKS